MTEPERPFTGMLALVTGGERGIGAAYVERLSGLGATVVSLDRALVPDRRTDDPVHRCEVDLVDEAATARVLDSVCAELGVPDVCVCNAGGGFGQMWENSPTRTSAEAVRRAIDLNLVTLANVCGPVGRAMSARGRGKIVTTSSTSALRPRTDGGYAHYAAAKAAVISFTTALACELGPHGVTANVIVPGAIRTERVAHLIDASGAAEVTEAIALRRLGTPDDLADVIEFLAGPHSDYVTGAVLPVDGGLAL